MKRSYLKGTLYVWNIARIQGGTKKTSDIVVNRRELRNQVKLLKANKVSFKIARMHAVTWKTMNIASFKDVG